MVSKKPKVVIIGAGMAGLTAANKLYTAAGSKEVFEVCVLEAGNRIGGRINTSEFGGDRIEMGATWIHGIGGSPVYRIAQEINSLKSEQPWECMDGSSEEAVTIAEGGYELSSSMVEPIYTLFTKLMNFAQGKAMEAEKSSNGWCIKNGGCHESVSVGSFLRKGLAAYWESRKEEDMVRLGFGGWTRKSLEEAIFAMFENTQRTYTSADDLQNLDFNAESEYRMFPGEEITIAKGYLSIIESLASVLPSGLIQLGRKVARIGWSPDGGRPVKLHFVDGSIMYADHVIITVSLGVLKQGIREDPGLFDPPLPSFKAEAISRLGFGVVNKLFLQLGQNPTNFPNLQMAFHQSDPPKLRQPWWMRRIATLRPIYTNSSVILLWFAGKEALQLESLSDEDIIDGVSTTISNFLPDSFMTGHTDSSAETSNCFKFVKVLKTKWGSDPLFLGSYSYVAVGSSGDDLDTMAEPLPAKGNNPLQILFAGEATHRTHYSTTHGAYFSGIREANRLLQHYCIGV
ncbi:PREDICTED: probable polyamine oxidase 5 [Ipomoea nil]|uniref:probable polyamine oxidase 5 n=1 Tax=Ipomoea nil TaxID=35883 RepID=UPI0009014D0B|nr:PREDICTED: probable polyamine oxidase 5 [Ipomoea nil]